MNAGALVAYKNKAAVVTAVTRDKIEIRCAEAGSRSVREKDVDFVVFYVDNTGEHGWAVHLHNQSDGNMKWSTQSTDIGGIQNYTIGRYAINDFNGYMNTMYARIAGNAATYPVIYSIDFENGWYLPSAGQLRCLLAQIYNINPSLAISGGTPFPTDSNWWFWSSTEYDATRVWTVQENGVMDITIKYGISGALQARSVRSF